MEDLNFEERGSTQIPASLQQHFSAKLGRQNELEKTPSRGGLGLVVNSSKTPGGKSLQSLASACKVPPSTKKNTIPIAFECYEDETDDQIADVATIKKTEKHPCSPIDTANRCETFDSLAADIEDDMLNLEDQDVVLSEDRPYGDVIDPAESEAEALAELGVEEWDSYPPIDPASRIGDDFNYVLRTEDFAEEGDVKLEETRHRTVIADIDEVKMSKAERNELFSMLADDLDSYDLLAEEANLPL